MAKNKTAETTKDVFEFIKEFPDSENKRNDSYKLVELMKEISGYDPKMWGPSIIGFGTYHYKYESGHEGDAPIIGFSPRKAALTLYVCTDLESQKHLLDGLGKFKLSKACMYVNKLSDVDLPKLRVLIKDTLRLMQLKYPDHSKAKASK